MWKKRTVQRNRRVLLEFADELIAIEGSNIPELPFSSRGDGLAFSERYSKVDVAWSSNWRVSYIRKKRFRITQVYNPKLCNIIYTKWREEPQWEG